MLGQARLFELTALFSTGIADLGSFISHHAHACTRMHFLLVGHNRCCYNWISYAVLSITIFGSASPSLWRTHIVISDAA